MKAVEKMEMFCVITCVLLCIGILALMLDEAFACENLPTERQKPLRWEFVEKRAPSAKSFSELVELSPRQIRKVSAYRTRKIAPEVTWGTLGWEKSVLAYRTPRQKALASKYLQGVEIDRVDTELEAFDMEDHWAFAAEIRCLNRRAGRVEHFSFGETVRLR